MTSIEAKRLAQRIARIEREQANQGKPQLAYSSIENGNLKSYEGNDLKMVVGLQDDGGQATTVFNGPTPPTPINYTVTVDHGSLTVHWDGEFEDGAVAPSDWARWTAYAQEGGAVTPSRVTAIGGTDSASGGEVTAGVLKGQWTVTVLAWSQAGKPSSMGLPVTVDVPGYGDIVLAEIDAAETLIKNGSDILVSAQDTLGGKLDSAFGSIDSINDDMSDLGDAVAGAVVSANGKNTVTYDDRPPTGTDEGITGDSWFVGQVGRPEDVVEATNLLANPSFETEVLPGYFTLNTSRSSNPMGVVSGSYCMAMATASASGSNWTGLDTLPVSLFPASKWVAFGLTVAGATGAKFIDVWADFYNGSTRVATTSDAYAPISAEQSRIVRAIQVPSVAFTQVRFLVRLRNSASGGAPADGVTYTDAWQIVVADTEAKARSIVGQYFDGDTPSGTTNNESHYRWTGTSHASTSEKYLPATDGLSENWNVTAQYRHDGNGWVEVELSHHVISSADVGKLVAGSATIKEACQAPGF
ncbi:hypothetical protein, partial [Brevibacterium sp.]